MVEVRQVRLPREVTPFLDVWWEVYKNDPHWVPPLRFERRHFFDATKNPYFRHAHAAYFIAYKDEKAVGTISAQIDNLSLQKEPDLGFFGFFEFLDDPEVSRALLAAAGKWLSSQGIQRMQGPFNFSTNHECGLLVDGFDGDPLVMMTYNPPYYLRHYEELGLVKAMDLYAYWLDAAKPVPPTLLKMNERFLSRHPEVKIRSVNLEDLETEMKALLTIYNDAWEDNWGAVRMDEAEMRTVVESIKPMLDTRFCYFLEIDGEPAALSVTLPDYNQVVKPMNGKLLPFGWYYWLTRPKKVNQLRVLVLGVRKKFQQMPLGLPLYMKTWEEGLKAGVRGAEASWILENNPRMRGALEKLGGTIYRTYRIFERSCA